MVFSRWCALLSSILSAINDKLYNVLNVSVKGNSRSVSIRQYVTFNILQNLYRKVSCWEIKLNLKAILKEDL